MAQLCSSILGKSVRSARIGGQKQLQTTWPYEASAVKGRLGELFFDGGNVEERQGHAHFFCDILCQMSNLVVNVLKEGV